MDEVHPMSRRAPFDGSLTRAAAHHPLCDGGLEAHVVYERSKRPEGLYRAIARCSCGFTRVMARKTHELYAAAEAEAREMAR